MEFVAKEVKTKSDNNVKTTPRQERERLIREAEPSLYKLYDQIPVGRVPRIWTEDMKSRVKEAYERSELHEYSSEAEWEDLITAVVASPYVSEGTASLGGTMSFDEGGLDDRIKDLQKKYKFSELLIAFAKSQGGEGPNLWANMTLTGEPPTGANKLQLMAASSVGTKYYSLLPDGYVWQKPIDIPVGIEHHLLEGSLVMKQATAAIKLSNLSFLAFVSQYDFRVERTKNAVTVKYGNISVPISVETGMVIDAKAARDFLVAWSGVNKKFTFEFEDVNIYDRFMANVISFAYTVNLSKDNWKFERNVQFAPTIAKRYWGVSTGVVEGFISKVIAHVKETPPAKQTAGIKSKAGIYHQLVQAVAKVAKSVPDRKMLEDIANRHDFLFDNDQDIQKLNECFKTGVFPGLPDAATIAKERLIDQGKRNVGPREEIAKRICAMHLEELPNSYSVAWKYQAALGRLPKFGGDVDIYGTAHMAFLEAIDEKFPENDKHFYDIDKSICGIMGGRTVGVKDITGLDPGIGYGKCLIDDTLVKVESDKNVWNQYGKLDVILKANYTMLVSKMMIGVDEPEPTLSHPIFGVYKKYKEVFLMRGGKQQSGEYIVCAYGLKEKAEITEMDEKKVKMFFGVARASMWASNLWMGAVTRYGVRRKLPEICVALWRIPVADVSKIKHKGVTKITGMRKLTGTFEEDVRIEVPLIGENGEKVGDDISF